MTYLIALVTVAVTALSALYICARHKRSLTLRFLGVRLESTAQEPRADGSDDAK